MISTTVKLLLLATLLVYAGKKGKCHDLKRSDDVSTSSLEILLQQQTALIETLQTRLTAAENKLNDVEGRVRAHDGKMEAIQQKQSTSVAFTARFSHENGSAGLPITSHSTLVFDKVMYNAGNGYNPRTGIFTAPVAGVYNFFLTQMSVDTHTYLQLLIVKEGATLDMVFAEGSADTHDQGSSLVATHLGAGEQVWVRQYHGDAVRGSWYTVFTGYLLHAD